MNRARRPPGTCSLRHPGHSLHARERSSSGDSRRTRSTHAGSRVGWSILPRAPAPGPGLATGGGDPGEYAITTLASCYPPGGGRISAPSRSWRRAGSGARFRAAERRQQLRQRADHPLRAADQGGRPRGGGGRQRRGPDDRRSRHTLVTEDNIAVIVPTRSSSRARHHWSHTDGDRLRRPRADRLGRGRRAVRRLLRRPRARIPRPGGSAARGGAARPACGRT